MDERAPSMLRACLVAGVLTGALAGVPYLKFVNTCTCCSFVVLGGLLASYLYSRECRAASTEFRPRTGANVGLIAGAFYAVAVTAVSTLGSVAFGQPDVKWFLNVLSQALENQPDVPADAQDAIQHLLDRIDEPIALSSVIWGFATSVVIGAAFSTLGGLIGGAMFKVECPPPAATPASPPASGDGEGGPAGSPPSW